MIVEQIFRNLISHSSDARWRDLRRVHRTISL